MATELVSAPLKPSVISAILVNSTSGPIGLPFAWISRILSLAALSGIGTKTILSNLPGRRSAGSIMSALFVAAITTTPESDCIPSSSVSNCETTRSVTMLSPPIPLVGAIESISSKNTTHGAACLALLNISLIPRSDSPTHLLNNSGPLTLIKLASDSVATAFASSVLPVPEGPCISKPFGIVCPSLAYRSGYLNGHSTASCSSRLTSSSPPMADHGMSGDSR